MTKPSTAATNRNSDKFMLRLPDGMRDTIAELAKQSGRSMNAEIVYRLQQSIDEEPVDGVKEMELRIVNPRLDGTQKIFTALEQMEKILTGTLKLLEEDEKKDNQDDSNA